MRAEAAKIAVCVRRREPSDESSAEEDGGPLQVQKHQAGHTSIILQAEHASTSIQQPRQLTIDGFFEDCPCSCPQLAAFLHRELVDNLFLGFNCSLLGCGSAEARKHVLSWETFGSVWSSVMALDRQRRIEQGWLSFLHFSACEITNEAILDLGLQPGQRPPSLRVRQHPQNGPFVHGLQRILHMMALLQAELQHLRAAEVMKPKTNNTGKKWSRQLLWHAQEPCNSTGFRSGDFVGILVSLTLEMFMSTV